MSQRKAGDFTGLAENYSRFRPGYSETILDAILGITRKRTADIDFVDVGAGTGIWSRMVATRKCKSTVSIEPNDDMRTVGEKDSQDSPLVWGKGTAESTGLENNSADLLTMASSFHWADFEKSTKEFTRVLRPGGHFAALWNPRLIEVNPLLVEIEKKLEDFVPKKLKRVSSGRSGITETLVEKLATSPYFDDVITLEGRHVSHQTPEHYVGVWRSVNDVRVQAGEKGFAEFMAYVEDRIKGIESIETTYLTRAWVVRTIQS